MNLWCDNQMIDENGNTLCCAYLAEARVFNCPYKNNDKRLKAEYPCSDYKNIEIKG